MVCPNCNKESSRLSKGCCRHCAIPLFVCNGTWFKSDPIKAVIEAFEKHASKQHHVPFMFPRTDRALYGAERKAAERLLNLAENNLDMAIACVGDVFSGKMAWKDRTSLRYIAADFHLALSMRKAEAAKKEEALRANKETLSLILEREDVFC